MRKTIIYTHFPKKQEFFPKKSGFLYKKNIQTGVLWHGHDQMTVPAAGAPPDGEHAMPYDTDIRDGIPPQVSVKEPV
jgi:hypothetical protein